MTFLRLRGPRITHRETVVLRQKVGSQAGPSIIHFMPRAGGPGAPGAFAEGRQAAPVETRIVLKTAAREAGGSMANSFTTRFVTRLAGGSAAPGMSPASALPAVGRLVPAHAMVTRSAPPVGGAHSNEVPPAWRYAPVADRRGAAGVVRSDGAEPIARRYRRIDHHPSPLRDEAAGEQEWTRGARNAPLRRNHLPARRDSVNHELDSIETEPMGRAPEPAPINVAQITDAVLQQLDRRLIAARERMGRI